MAAVVHHRDGHRPVVFTASASAAAAIFDVVEGEDGLVFHAIGTFFEFHQGGVFELQLFASRCAGFTGM